jgi:hypothetical protein
MLGSSILTLTCSSTTTVVTRVSNCLSLALLEELGVSNLLCIIMLLLSKLVLIYIRYLKCNNLQPN